MTDHRPWEEPRDRELVAGCASDMSIAAQAPPANPAVELWAALQEVRDDGKALELIEAAFDQVGDGRAAEAMVRIINRLGRTKRDAQLRAALLGTVMTQAEARRFGISRQTLQKNVQRLRDKLLPKRVSAYDA